MINDKIEAVDISIGPNMYARLTDFPNTPSHVLAEFVDNALQSFRDKKEALLAKEPHYRLQISIEFEWNAETGKADCIRVVDNAGGIDSHSYEKAFKLANTPENNQGLNEYGMGLKTAALWLGKFWEVKTSALGEPVSRTISFDLQKVTSLELSQLEVLTEPENADKHYTTIVIKDPTDKSPSKKSLEKIKNEISSIYRKSLRQNEADIYVDGEKLTFEETEILCAPSTKDPNGPVILWKKDIDFVFGKYRATGFIGILKTIDSTKNGFVLLRRGRVVYGAETDGRYFPKSISGSIGTFQYKRMFGELELEGFDVSFNKNDIQDKENLEALMIALRGEIRTKDFDLIAQAENYRLDVRQKTVNKIVIQHNKAVKKGGKIVINTPAQGLKPAKIVQPTLPLDEPVPLGTTNDVYTINGQDYTLRVEMVNEASDLFWLDTTQKDQHIIVCKINIGHAFFKHFKDSETTVVTMLKTMALAKFTAKEYGNDSTTELFQAFNDYIKNARI